MTNHPIPPPPWTTGLPGTIDITRETGTPEPSIRYTRTVSDIPTPDMTEADGIRVAIASIAALWIERDPDRAEWIHNAPLVVFGPRNGRPAMHLDPVTAEQLGWALLRAVETATGKPIGSPDLPPRTAMVADTETEPTAPTILEWSDTAEHASTPGGRVLTGVRRIKLVTTDKQLADGVAGLVAEAAIRYANAPVEPTDDTDQPIVIGGPAAGDPRPNHPGHLFRPPVTTAAEPTEDRELSPAERLFAMGAAARPVTAEEPVPCTCDDAGTVFVPNGHNPACPRAARPAPLRLAAETTAEREARERVASLPDATITLSGTYGDTHHVCAEQCLCPIHGTPLIYAPASRDHACQDATCRYGHGIRALLDPGPLAGLVDDVGLIDPDRVPDDDADADAEHDRRRLAEMRREDRTTDIASIARTIADEHDAETDRQAGEEPPW